MKCPKCNSDVTVKIETAAHDENSMDVQADCDECDWSAYQFLYCDEFVENE